MNNYIFLIALTILFTGCSKQPSDEFLVEIIEESMKKEMPPHVMGTLAGGQLIRLEEIEIEQVEKAKYKPNAVFKAFGSEPYDYWKVLARVKGVGRVGVGGLANSMLYGKEKRGFHGRSIWSIHQKDDGQWKISFSILDEGIEQPASPSWWVINEKSVDEIHSKPYSSFIGDWYDGGPDCMKISSSNNDDDVLHVKVWYCSTGEPTTPIEATFDGKQLVGKDGKLRISQISESDILATYQYPPPNEGVFKEGNKFEKMNDGIGVY